MNTFEISSKRSKNGRRRFKVILHEIYPDSCVDEVNGVGMQFNENGITWIEEYCKNALSTIPGTSLKCEFIDEERTELCGHGETEFIDGLPIFENAVVIGQFDKGYITEIETDEGLKTVCIGEGTIDGLCYHNFVTKLDEDLMNGMAPNGSVEILKTGDNPGIVYKYGQKPHGRIPTIFEYSGYALLGVRPADQTAKILELNNLKKEDNIKMDRDEIKAIVSQVVGEMASNTNELNQCKEECANSIAEAQALVTAKDAEISELNQAIETMKAELESCKAEKDTLVTEKETLSTEINSLKATLEEAQKKEKVGELNSAIASFSDEEKGYAKAEIEAFNADPLTSEINSVVNKIWEGIGRNSKNVQAAADDCEDIFSEVCEKAVEEDVDIF